MGWLCVFGTLDPLWIQVIWHAGLSKHPPEAHECDVVFNVHASLTWRRAFHDGFLISVLPDASETEAVKMLHIQPEIPREY